MQETWPSSHRSTRRNADSDGGTRRSRRASKYYDACFTLVFSADLVECFFSIITRQAIRRGSFTSLKELVSAIGAFIDHWNDHTHPFAWTKDADEILGKIERARTQANGRPYTPRA